MKNYKILLYIFSILGLIMTTSCDEIADAPEASSITFLPKITLEGDINLELDCNTTSYTDPGAVATAGTTEIDMITTITGTYFGSSTVNGPDVYSIAYQAFNDDNIPAAGFRQVSWPPCSGDLVTSIAGVYTCSMTRTPGYSTDGIGPIYIKDMGNGVYAISDAIGGWYEHEYGYGPNYAAKGMTVTANDIAANSFTLNGSSTLPWGGNIVLSEFSVDPSTNTIEMKTEWSLGYVWDITLTLEE